MTYLVIAYGLIAIVLFGYVLTLYRRTAQVERRIRELDGEKD